MCSQFTIKFSQAELFKHLANLKLNFSPLDGKLPSRAFPGTQTLALKHEEESDQAGLFEWMRFGLIPRWAKEEKVPFATHNARIETLLEKPTWKDAFLKRHCVIPMSGFIESIYTGKHAGFCVEIAAPDKGILFAAGIWEAWENKKSGEVLESFSVITRDPYPQVQKVGHDRSPIFLSLDGIKTWLKMKGPGEKQIKDLLDLTFTPKFEIENDRPLKPGWEKRIPKK